MSSWSVDVSAVVERVIRHDSAHTAANRCSARPLTSTGCRHRTACGNAPIVALAVRDDSECDDRALRSRSRCARPGQTCAQNPRKPPTAARTATADEDETRRWPWWLLALAPQLLMPMVPEERRVSVLAPSTYALTHSTGSAAPNEAGFSSACVAFVEVRGRRQFACSAK